MNINQEESRSHQPSAYGGETYIVELSSAQASAITKMLPKCYSFNIDRSKVKKNLKKNGGQKKSSNEVKSNSL